MTVVGSIIRWVFLGLLLVVLSCSSDDGGGTGGSGVVAVGTVTRVGSVEVTGITFDTTDATIFINGQPGDEADLHVGQVVTVRGTLDASGTAGTADTVEFDSNVEGPIDSINPTTNSLIVLGQIVVVDDTTQFGATPFDALVVGNIVEVSGFVDANGVLRATRVDKTQDAFIPGFEIEVEGTVANLDTVHQTFTLQTLTVDFSEVPLLGTSLANGQFVQVTSTHNVVGGVLLAQSVDIKNAGINGEAGQRVEFQGLITSVTSAQTFEVNGQAVRITNNTVFEGGTAADIVLNAGVEVEGHFDAEGVVVAEDVDIGGGGEIELEGVVTAVDSIANTFVITGGQTVRLTAATVSGEGTAITINDINVNDQLQVEGFFQNSVFVALAIEFFVDIEGSISSAVNPTTNTFEVDDGQAVHTVRITNDTVFEGGTEVDIAIGVQVEVEGLFDASGVLDAIAVEFLE